LKGARGMFYYLHPPAPPAEAGQALKGGATNNKYIIPINLIALTLNLKP